MKTNADSALILGAVVYLSATLASAQPAPRPAVSAAQQPPAASVEVELVFWQSIATSTNPADFEAYLEEFPDGVFRRLAGNRLEALQDTADAPAPPPVPVGGVGSTAPNWEELEVESPYDVCVYIDVVPEVLEVLEVVNGPPVVKACYAKARCVGFSAGIPDINATVICLLTPEGGCPPAFQCYLDPRVQFSKPSNVQDLQAFDPDTGRIINPGR